MDTHTDSHYYIIIWTPEGMGVPPDPVDDPENNPEDDPEDDPADPYSATKINKCHDLLKLFMCNYMIMYTIQLLYHL